MRAVRWCPTHSLVIPDDCDAFSDGMRCPAGHEIGRNGDHWVVDLDYPQEDERFCMWVFKEGVIERPPYYKARDEREIEGLAEDAAMGPDYIGQPIHWAKTRKKAGHQWTTLERVFKGKV